MGNLSSKRGSEQLNTTPTGLYDHCEWDPKVVRRLILEKKLAPISVGKEEASEEGLEECPICFLYHSGGLNRSRCCRKGACTECYLQVKRPNQNTTCPFCNHAQYIVTFSGPLSREEIAQEAQEQMKVLELKINMRKEEIERDKQREMEKERLHKERDTLIRAGGGNVPVPTTSPSTRATQSVPSNSLQPPFGSSLNQNYLASSYPPPTTAEQHYVSFEEGADHDLEDLMFMEAIRLSLLEVQPDKDAQVYGPNITTTTSAPIPSSNYNNNSDDVDSDDADSDCHDYPYDDSITTNSTIANNANNLPTTDNTSTIYSTADTTPTTSTSTTSTLTSPAPSDTTSFPIFDTTITSANVISDNNDGDGVDTVDDTDEHPSTTESIPFPDTMNTTDDSSTLQANPNQTQIFKNNTVTDTPDQFSDTATNTTANTSTDNNINRNNVNDNNPTLFPDSSPRPPSRQDYDCTDINTTVNSTPLPNNE